MKFPQENHPEPPAMIREIAELKLDFRDELKDKVEMMYLGKFTCYAYCPCVKCCGKDDGITRTGTTATEGRTIAVDPNVIPLGSTVYINGHAYIAEDTGVKGNTIDIFMNSHQAALNWGEQYWDVYIEI